MILFQPCQNSHFLDVETEVETGQMMCPPSVVTEVAEYRLGRTWRGSIVWVLGISGSQSFRAAFAGKHSVSAEE